MLFIYPMWDSESQRIGKQKCTPSGYFLHGLAELLGYIGLLLIVLIGLYLGYRKWVGTFHDSLFLLLIVPFIFGLIAEGLYGYSWKLASNKEFRYDDERLEASWIENGQRQTYKHVPTETKTGI